MFNFDTNIVGVFNKIKKVSHAKNLGLYDPEKELALEVYDIQKGLGTCLLQDHIPISFASKNSDTR